MVSAPWVGGRLKRVEQDLVHGIDWTRSLRYHGLIRASDAAVLESAQRVGNLTWAMRQTAETGERRLALRLQLLIQILYPLVLFLIAALVGLIGAAYFAPLVMLIERLSG